MFVRACVYLGMWGMYIIAAAAVEMCSSLQLGLWMWCRLNLGGGGLLQVDAIGMVVDCCVAGHAASRVPVAAIDGVQLCSSWMGVTFGLFCDCNTMSWRRRPRSSFTRLAETSERRSLDASTPHGRR